MRSFQKILAELKEVVNRHRPGDELRPPASMPFVEINGRKVFYAAAGIGQQGNPPVVLLHGFGGFFMDWPRVMAPIARVTEVYALDLPGWGFSEPNLNSRSLEDEVKMVGHFLAKLGLRNAILCGISYGAGVAWASAALRLPRVSRAVLLNPMPPHPLRYMKSRIYRAIFFMSSFQFLNRITHVCLTKAQYKIICRENLLNDRLLDTFYLDLAFMMIKQPKIKANLARHAQGAAKIDWSVWEHRLQSVRVPVTILQAENDKVFSMESARYLQTLIPESTLVPISDCGHAMVFDQHRKVTETLLKMIGLERHEPVEKAVQVDRKK